MRRSLPVYVFLCATILLSCAAWAQTPLTYLNIGPCRVVDTREATGPFGGPSLAAENTRTFNLPSQPDCQIPATAMAYSLNVTVVPSSGFLGYLTVWPAGQPQPGVSTLNSYDGSIKADAVVVGAGTSGGISVFATDETDVIIDITGYFVGPQVNADSLEYFSLEGPCRIVDTTNVAGPLGGPALAGDTTRTFDLTTPNGCGIPANTGALAVNLTANPINGAPIEYIQMWPQTSAQPETSVLNDPNGQITSNLATVAWGNGSISVFSTDPTNFAMDVVGYFAPPGIDGLAFYPIAPCRVYDSRTVNGGNPFTGQVDVNVAASSACVGLPQFPPLDGGAVRAQVADRFEQYDVNATALPEANTGFVTVWGQFFTPPLFSELYAYNSLPASNLTLPDSDNGWISAFTASPANLVLDLFGYFDLAALQIISPLSGATLPAATANVPYGPVTITAQGGVPPYMWSDGGTLPATVAIGAASGAIAGCPLAAVANAPVKITATDSVSATATADYTLTVNALKPLAITTTSPLPPVGFNVAYSETLAATGGNTPYTWSLIGGSLPPGLSLSSAGVISGVVQQQGAACSNFFPIVQVADTECGATAQPPVSMEFDIFVSGPMCF